MLFARLLVLFVLAVLGGATTSLAQTGQRVALVIGNSAYSAVGPLPNPTGDAQAIEAALDRIGFDARYVADADRTVMLNALRDFAILARGAEQAIVYFAGHGIEVLGVNYLIPTDATLQYDTDAPFEAITLDLVLGAVQGASGLGLVILDACRNNPFAAQMRSTTPGQRAPAGRGLLAIEPFGSTFVAYAARGGTLANDGVAGGHSPYTQALLNHIETPGLDIWRLFGLVAYDVREATGGVQQPWLYGTPGRDAVHVVPPTAAASAGPPGSAPTPPPGSAATAYQRAIGAWEALPIGDGAAALLIEATEADSFAAQVTWEFGTEWDPFDTALGAYLHATILVEHLGLELQMLVASYRRQSSINSHLITISARDVSGAGLPRRRSIGLSYDADGVPAPFEGDVYDDGTNFSIQLPIAYAAANVQRLHQSDWFEIHIDYDDGRQARVRFGKNEADFLAAFRAWADEGMAGAANLVGGLEAVATLRGEGFADPVVAPSMAWGFDPLTLETFARTSFAWSGFSLELDLSLGVWSAERLYLAADVEYAAAGPASVQLTDVKVRLKESPESRGDLLGMFPSPNAAAAEGELRYDLRALAFGQDRALLTSRNWLELVLTFSDRTELTVELSKGPGGVAAVAEAFHAWAQVPFPDDATVAAYREAAVADTVAAWNTFLQLYPDGYYADLARAKLADLPPPRQFLVASCVGRGGVDTLHFWGPAGEDCMGAVFAEWGQFGNDLQAAAVFGQCTAPLENNGVRGVTFYGPVGAPCLGRLDWGTYQGDFNVGEIGLCGCSGDGVILADMLLWGPPGAPCGGFPTWGTFDQFCVRPED